MHEITYAPIQISLAGDESSGYSWDVRAGMPVGDRADAYRRGVSMAGEDNFHIAVVLKNGPLVEILDSFFVVPSPTLARPVRQEVSAKVADGRLLEDTPNTYDLWKKLVAHATRKGKA